MKMTLSKIINGIIYNNCTAFLKIQLNGMSTVFYFIHFIFIIKCDLMMSFTYSFRIDVNGRLFKSMLESRKYGSMAFFFHSNLILLGNRIRLLLFLLALSTAK